jgi:DNA-binding transcriptional regulator YdaS (Cro superfamily)
MTAAQFQRAQRFLGMNNQQMAEYLGCSLSHVENMRGGRREISATYQRIIVMSTPSCDTCEYLDDDCSNCVDYSHWKRYTPRRMS